MRHTPNILVAACGNETAGGDAFGPLVARALRESDIERTLPIKIADLGMNPTCLLDHLPGPDLLILVDAAYSDAGRPGQLIDTDWFSPGRPPLACDTAISSHALSIAGQAELAHRLRILPRGVRLVAVTIGPTATGAPVPETIRNQVPRAAARIIDHAHRWAEAHGQPA